jgi:hypothetical protein
MSDLQARIDALAVSLRPHAASPVTARRKSTDSKPPAGADNYGTRKNTNANRRNGGGSCFYRAKAEDYAGAAMVTPPTTRPSAANIKPANGVRITGYTNVQDARVIGTDNEYRAFTAERTNLSRDAGDIPARVYPTNRTARGNLTAPY